MISLSGRLDAAITQALKSQDTARHYLGRLVRTSLKNRIEQFQKEKLSAV